MGEFSCQLGGSPVRVNHSTGNDNTAIAFSYMGNAYEFKIQQWCIRGWSNFAKAFHDCHDNYDLWGSSSEDDNGLVRFDISPEKKQNIIESAVKDIMNHLDLLLTQYGKQILGYAVWYREKSGGYDTYEDYITKMTCHCIVDSQFISGNVQWQRAAFQQLEK